MEHNEILECVSRFLDDRSCMEHARAQMIITLNSEMVGLTRGDKEFDKAVAAASLIVPDGIGVVLASRVLGCPVRERMEVKILRIFPGIQEA
jgi:UDP-N-acetyl-D-mannosaminuronic acid transferase (WecB/TagA/CpsF family)